MPANTIPPNPPVSQQDDALRRARAADQNWQTRRALTALAATTPRRRPFIAQAATDYLSQVDRRCLPVGYQAPIDDDRRNRIDAYRMRGGDTLTRMLGLAVHPADEYLPQTARAVLANINATVDQLTDAARRTGNPLAVATIYMATGAIPTEAPQPLATNYDNYGSIWGHDTTADSDAAIATSRADGANINEWNVTDRTGRLMRIVRIADPDFLDTIIEYPAIPVPAGAAR